MFTGTWTLVRLILRRDRLKLPLWLIGIVVLLISMVPLLKNVYGDEASLQTLYATFSSNPAGLFLTGPLDSPTLGGLMTIETLLWWGLAVAFMNTLLVVRHTRQNEEMGAQELILSGRVHRATGLVAVLVVAFLANLILILGIGAGLSFYSAGAWTTENAWLYAFAMGLFGFAWAAIAMVVVQLVENTRSANGILASMIGLAFVVRGIGDFTSATNAQGLTEPSWWSWLSPFGWMQATRPLTAPEWWPLIVPVLCGAVLILTAFILLTKRDVGRGLLPSRKGKERASASLRTPAGLTWYIQKNVFFGWLIGAIVMATTIGVLVPEMSNVYESNDSMKAMIETMGGAGALIPSFLSAMLSIMALMSAAYAIHGIGKLRSEEYSGHLENILATRISRLVWLGLHTISVLLGGAIILAATGLVLACCVNLVSADYTANIFEYVLASLSYMPIVALFTGLYVLLFGLAPRAAGAAVWLYYGFVVFITWLGPLLNLNNRITSMSVMEHVAVPPAETVNIISVIAISGIALVAITCGSFGWRYRNLLER